MICLSARDQGQGSEVMGKGSGIRGKGSGVRDQGSGIGAKYALTQGTYCTFDPKAMNCIISQGLKGRTQYSILNNLTPYPFIPKHRQ